MSNKLKKQHENNFMEAFSKQFPSFLKIKRYFFRKPCVKNNNDQFAGTSLKLSVIYYLQYFNTMFVNRVNTLCKIEQNS